MNSAQEDRQPLFMKADYDSSGWKLGWVTVKFGFTTVRQIEFCLNFFIMLNLKFKWKKKKLLAGSFPYTKQLIKHLLMWSDLWTTIQSAWIKDTS